MNTHQQIRDRIKTHLADQFGLPDQQLESMIPVFIDTLRGHLAALESAVAAGGCDQIGRAAHTMKGALLNLGLAECAETAAAIEREAKAASTRSDYRNLVASIGAALEPLLN
jgi:HPt (histidine-containing phosphotransfer) domain-containing protein